MADYANLPCRDEVGNLLVVVEAPRNSLVKIKYSTKLRVFEFGRPLTLGVAYPYDWGFVPSTMADDGDPLDAMVLFDCPTWPGTVIPSIEIGIVMMTQEEDKRFTHVNELSKRTRKELEQFFVTASLMTKKEVRIESWEGPKAAREAVEEAVRKYTKGGKR